jgi:hypothetical protein
MSGIGFAQSDADVPAEGMRNEDIFYAEINP